MTDEAENQESDTRTERSPETSKSERKRQALALQKLGARLTELNPGALAGLDLPARLADAIALHQRITSREAKRRQLQYIGALMRDYDTAPIEAALETLHGESASARYQLHQVEIWRDRLVADPAVLTEYLDSHPDADRQRLRHALQKVARSPQDPQRRGASRALFRILREFEVPT
ncbi:MAG: ribosome biogenesis factor YjgA [Pseudomonadales bacterium]